MTNISNLLAGAAAEAEFNAARAVAQLSQVLTLLPVKDHDFAKSLVDGHRKYGRLSPKQAQWVQIMLDRASKATAPKQKVDLVRLTSLFTKAISAGLKNPAIRIGGFKLSPAKPGSANYGSVYVKAGEAYLGKISAAGDWNPSRDAGGMAEIAFEKVSQFACDPVSAAAAEGHATGSCCFCARELSDAGSIEVGYGPICAEKYGLPHEPKGHGVKLALNEQDENNYDGGRDEDGYGWEDRALAGAYNAA